jgi:RNase P/RNase MRP subunit POP5
MNQTLQPWPVIRRLFKLLPLVADMYKDVVHIMVAEVTGTIETIEQEIETQDLKDLC